MAHHPRPFYRKSRGLWYVQINGRQINLGRDEDAAFRKYHGLMAAPPPPRRAESGPFAVGELFDAFLDWCHKHRSKRTYEGHKWHLSKFHRWLADAAMPAGDLRPHHLIAYTAGMTAKQREQGVPETVINDYNRLRSLVVEACPNLEEILPPEARMRDLGLGLRGPSVRYQDVHAFCEQIVGLLQAS